MCVGACHVTQYHSHVKNKVVAKLAVRIAFTYGIHKAFGKLFGQSRKITHFQFGIPGFCWKIPRNFLKMLFL